MRYEAKEGAQGWFVFDTANPCRMAISESVEEAESKIIAFALNAVADGYELSAEHPEKMHSFHFDPECFRTYDGPTDL